MHNEVFMFLEEGPFPVFQSANAVPDPLHGCSHKRWWEAGAPKRHPGFAAVGIF